MSKKAIIVSLKFHPGHVSHLVASYKQCQELGYEAYYYVNEGFVKYLPVGSNIWVYGKDKPKNVALAVSLFPHPMNLIKILGLKIKNKTRDVYIFHEPLDKFSTFRKAGFSYVQMTKVALVGILNAICVKIADAVLLPSEKAVEYYDRNSLYKNKNRYYIPLMYDDEASEKSYNLKMTPEGRFYFSYIGTIAPDHSYNECVEFMLWAIENDKMPEMQFLIATKDSVERTERIKAAMETHRLRVVDGRPMSTSEINNHYRASFAIWNAYTRTMQSGVLPKAFMFGTPALVMKKNLAEYTVHGQEVVAIEDNTSFEEIELGIKKIMADFENYSGNCRKRFLETFYYKKYNDKLVEIIR